ncbi:MAG TPA: N-6 DNA methylase [Rhizomicrobium sp.]
MNFAANETAQKLRGGYYTPHDLAHFAARWIGEIEPRKILEPSCGDGVFIGALREAGIGDGAKVTAFELDRAEALKAHRRAKEAKINADVKAEDFLGWAFQRMCGEADSFDAVVGNPPFIRYQYLPEAFQRRAELIFAKLGCHFTRHTNAWVPFVLASISFLRPGGRLAMVLPAELIHVTHAQSLRTYLGNECRRLVVIDPEKLWFEDTLQGAVLLLAEKRRDTSDRAEGLGIYSVKNREFLKRDPSQIFRAPQAINGKTVEGKWTRALLNGKTRALYDELSEHDDVHSFDDIAEVDVGIVTGANKFFLVNDSVVKRFGLENWAHPMFGRSEHCPGVIYDRRQHRANEKAGNPTNLIWFKSGDERDNDAARAYIEFGESQNLHTRYKCRVRSPWYSVPSVYPTEIGMLKRAHHAPRLILNRKKAYTTDTAYRIRTKNLKASDLVRFFVNPLTALSAELEGRHYGGGVLELVPSEIEKMLVPVPKRFDGDIAELDSDMRIHGADHVQERHGARVLRALKLSKAQIDDVIEAWRMLRNRRHRVSSDDENSVD